jgi:predicted dienelactone hydrolase
VFLKSLVAGALFATAWIGSAMAADNAAPYHVAGFSLGGYTVLELAGARTNLQAFESFCRSPAADAICRPPEMARLQNDAGASAAPSAETAASLARAGASYRDERIKAVLGIAPALGEAFDAASFAEVHVPVSLVGGTADETVPVETNIKRGCRSAAQGECHLAAGGQPLHLPRYLRRVRGRAPGGHLQGQSRHRSRRRACADDRASAGVLRQDLASVRTCFGETLAAKD